jgi:TolB-like protein
MFRVFSFLAVATLSMTSAPSRAATWKAGERCTVDKAFKVSGKARGKGRKTRLDAGTVLTVVEVGRFGVRVTGDGGEGYITGKVLSRRCTRLAPEAAPPPAPEVPPPALEPEPEIPEAETPPPVAPTAAADPPPSRELTAGNPNEAASLGARDLVADLETRLGHPPAMVFMTPFRKPGGDINATVFVNALAAALVNERGTPLIERSSVKAALEEAALMQGATDKSLSEVAGAFGADVMVAGSVDTVGNSYSAHVRAVAVKDASLLAAVKITFTVEGEAIAMEARSLEAQLRRLGDRLAEGLQRLSGDLRYQRVAVLPFDEQGATTRDRELGLLVSAELTTVLRRDHGVMLIERSQLGSVLDEMALGQTGLVEPAQAVEVGKLSGAQGLVIGSVSEAGDRYLVNARVVSADSGDVVFADDVPLPAADLVALSSEAVVLRSRTGALYRSLLLPGWGQLYNREPIKGGVFAGAEVAAIAAAVGFHIRGVDWQGKYDDLGAGEPIAKFDRRRDRAETAFMWRNIFIYVAIGIHAANVLEALISGRSYDPAMLDPASQAVGFGGGW